MVRSRSQSALPDSVTVIFSVIRSLGRGREGDLLPDEETSAIADSAAQALAAEGLQVSSHPVEDPAQLAALLSRLDPAETLIFNLCESLGGIEGEGTSTASGEIVAARWMAQAGFRFTGADPQALERCLDKGATHRLLEGVGVPVAPYRIYSTIPESGELPYPVIVKPVREDCSLAITEESVVDNDADLRREVGRLLSDYRQPALVERFLDGREFSVSVWGDREPAVVGTGQIDFSTCDDPRRRLETFENKWSDRFPGRYPAPVTEVERGRLEQLGVSAYRGAACSGYGRVDIREDSGELYVLEVNPNPSLAIDAGFARAAAASGIGYGTLLRRLVEQAWGRTGGLRPTPRGEDDG